MKDYDYIAITIAILVVAIITIIVIIIQGHDQILVSLVTRLFPKQGAFAVGV